MISVIEQSPLQIKGQLLILDDRATPHLALDRPDFKGQSVMAVDVRDNVTVFRIDM